MQVGRQGACRCRCRRVGLRRRLLVNLRGDELPALDVHAERDLRLHAHDDRHCRSLGIPTRYVSGYLYKGPQSQLRGAQASHAWCEVHVPGREWFGMDPTNDTQADERHVKIATGRADHRAF
ncbi:MAG: transglutaminase-like domain-containing protein [Prosthecobacter sp.]